MYCMIKNIAQIVAIALLWLISFVGIFSEGVDNTTLGLLDFSIKIGGIAAAILGGALFCRWREHNKLIGKYEEWAMGDKEI